MTENERKSAAKQFAQDWAGRGDEKQETQSFWLSLLQKVYGVEDPAKYIQFELPVKLSHTSFIDGYIESTRVLIEQKSKDIDLRKGAKQSDGSILSPFQQARRYAGYLPHNQNPRWIVVSNFQSFEIHDMNRPNDAPEVVQLSELEKDYSRLNFLVDTGDENIKREMEISLQAGELVGVLYDAFLKQYKNPDDPETLKSLNKLCVRLVFCLYAEDAGIFGRKNLFHDYLAQFDAKAARKGLRDLFRVLDQKPEDRDPYLSDDDPILAAFPYVNGGLFADENIEIPPLTDELLTILLNNASGDFDWSEISPTIFGAVFESTLNPETRRSGGMHYTSIENIHKVIDPLFLNDLRAEFAEIDANPIAKTKNSRLKDFQKKLAGLTFLDIKTPRLIQFNYSYSLFAA
ncbi:MAG: methylase [Oscillospiraceae bacterium]|nr:methylase [Oscillospiraceae bacterium]